MRKTRVAFVAEILYEDFDGAARTMFQLIKRIPKQFFDFLFLCGSGDVERYGFDALYAHAITIPFNSRYKMVLPGLSSKRIVNKLEAFQPDVVHLATPSPLGFYMLKWAVKNQKPVISVYHTHFVSYVDYYFKLLPFLVKPVKAWAERKVKKFYNQCDLVYVPSESMLVELERMGVEPSRMTLWKRGIDTTLFSPAKRNLQMMQQLTGNQNPVVLFVSRLVWEKNLEILIAVYELALQRNAAINFVVAGDGVAYEELKTKMPSATFLGTLDYEKLPVVYASSDVFLFPSISETYGNVVIEAMASGLPCVVADGGGSRDFIDQGVNGFKCDANNAEDYLERISQLLADDTLRTNIISAAREYSFTESWSRLSNRYFNDVEKLSKQKLAGIITVG